MVLLNVNIGGSALYQYLSGFGAALAIVTCGMHYGWSAPSLPILLGEASPIKIDEDMGYMLITAPVLGIVAGDLITPVLVDNIGRHKTILLTSIPYLLSWILIFFSTNYEMLLTARLVAGISCGMSFCSVPMYIGEISEPRIRGLLGVSIAASGIGGLLLVDIIGSYCSIKTTALISCAVPLAMIVIFVFMPESPYFLIMKGKRKAAKQKLKILRGTNDVDKEITRIEKGIQEGTSKKSNPLDLIRVPSNRKAMIIILSLKAITEGSGESAINFYAQNIFKEAGTSITEQVASIVLFSLELIVTATAAGLVDRAGRRPLLIFSAIGSAIALLVEGAYFYLKFFTNIDLSSFTLVPLFALVSFVVCSSAGLKVVHVLMVGELFPQGIKATAVCVSDIFAAAVLSLVTKFFQVTRDKIGMYFPFFSFGAVCLIGLIFIIFCVPETKGKTLEDIQDYLKGDAKTDKESNDCC